MRKSTAHLGELIAIGALALGAYFVARRAAEHAAATAEWAAANLNPTRENIASRGAETVIGAMTGNPGFSWGDIYTWTHGNPDAQYIAYQQAQADKARAQAERSPGNLRYDPLTGDYIGD